MQLKPLGNHIIVEVAPKETTTSSGIILPDSEEKRPERGVIIAVGPGKMQEDGKRETLDVKVGDTVIFKKYAPDEIELKDGDVKKKYLVLSADDVMAIVE